MKGVHNKSGNENLEVLLINNGGHDKRTIEGAAMRVERYGMESFRRIRFNSEEFDKEVAAAFGQYNYGKFVMDKEGLLVGIDLRGRAFMSAVDAACGTTAHEYPLDGFALKVEAVDVKGGVKGLFSRSGKLDSDLTGTLQLSFQLPKGWHVSGGADAAPKAAVSYSGGVEVGEAETWTPSEANLSPPLRLPLKLSEGMPIGRYFIHGTVRVMACDEEGCLPPVDLPWEVTLKAL